jgi:hypothetical protein
MAQQVISTGTGPNTGTGDPGFTAWTKANANFTELYSTIVTPPVGANPTASLGLAAINGSATTFMRSDGAPALSQSIVPTWTGTHTFSTGVVLNGGANIANATSLAWRDNVGTARGVLFMFTDNNVYLDNQVGIINVRTGAAPTIRATVNAAGNVAIAVPDSGTALTVNGISTAPGLTVQTANAGVGALFAGTTKGLRIFNSAGASNVEGVDNTGTGSYQPLIINGSQTAFQVAAVNAMSIGTAGNVTVFAPTSGTTLDITGLAATTTVVSHATNGGTAFNSVLTGSACSAFGASCPAATQMTALQFQQAGQTQWVIYNPASSSDMRFFAGADRVVFSAAGNVTMNAPTSGNTLSVTGATGGRAIAVTGSNTLAMSIQTGNAGGLYIDNTLQGAGTPALRIDVSATTGTATPTLGTVKPGANTAASQWLPISINGTTMYIPCWL